MIGLMSEITDEVSFGRRDQHLHLKSNCNTSISNLLLFCSCYSTKKDKPEVKPPSKVTTYAVKKYVSYVERIEGRLEKRFPNIYKVYKLFKDGTYCLQYFAMHYLGESKLILCLMESPYDFCNLIFSTSCLVWYSNKILINVPPTDPTASVYV